MYLPWKNLTDLLRHGISACSSNVSAALETVLPLPYFTGAGNRKSSTTPVARGSKSREETPPAPRLVFRVGITGHLNVPDVDGNRNVLNDVLRTVRDTTKGLAPQFAEALPSHSDAPDPQLRLLTQLAAGVDQLAAKVARNLGYRIQAVLPFHREEFEKDIAASAGGDAALREFKRLIHIIKADTVDCRDGNAIFELPFSREARNQAYAEANRIILNQIDLLVVMVDSKAANGYGGSVWFEGKALEHHIPVIRIPLDNPHAAELTWFPGGWRSTQHLYRFPSSLIESPVVASLLEGILTIPNAECVRQTSTGTSAATRIYLAQLPRAHDWDCTERWSESPDDAIVINALGNNTQCIDDSFREAYCWADFMARGYGEIYRGTAVLTSLLGTLAVAAAVLAIPMPWAALRFKVAEALVIALLIIVYLLEKKTGWRIRWLNYRQLAEQLRHARYLILLGRAIPVDVPAHMQEFQEKARWFNWYVRALLRQASLPTACLDRDYVEAVRCLMETRQVASQERFFEKAQHEQHEANEHLETWVGLLVGLVLAATLLYIAGHLLVERFGTCQLQRGMDIAGKWVMVVGALFPAAAAALSAIKSHGEYAQNDLRYQGMARELKSVERELSAYGTQLDKDLLLGYNNIAKRAVTTTAYLLEEVNQWRTILQMKVLERT